MIKGNKNSMDSLAGRPIPSLVGEGLRTVSLQMSSYHDFLKQTW